MSLRVVLRDTIRLTEGQPEELVIGEFEAISLSGVAMFGAMFGDDVLIARHEDGLGWGLPFRTMREEGDPRSFIYSDMTIEQVGS